MTTFKPLLFTLLLFCNNHGTAQFLTQSADGKSTIPLPLKGVGVGIDIGKTEVTVGVNNYARVLSSRDKAFKNNYLIGMNLSGKSEEGFANLFASGNIVPAGNFLGFWGYSVSNNKKLIDAFYNSNLFKSLQDESVKKSQLFQKYKDDLQLAVRLNLLLISDISLREDVEKVLIPNIQEMQEPGDLEGVLSKYKPEEERLKEFWKGFKEDIHDLKKVYVESVHAIHTETSKVTKNAYEEYMDSSWPVRLTAFVLGGINARSFKRFLQLDPANLSNSFQDTLFRGGTIGLGMNLQVKNYWLGVTYSYIEKDNFSALKSKEYTLRTSDGADNQLLISEKKITAYSGKYARVRANELNMDLVGDYRLSDSSRLIANLYLRGSLFSGDTAYLQNYTNVGTGLYFTGKKSKFLGGIYIELPDINNNAEKAKPADEINIQSPFKKLTFGIVTKFNISSLFTWANRPASTE